MFGWMVSWLVFGVWSGRCIVFVMCLCGCVCCIFVCFFCFCCWLFWVSCVVIVCVIILIICFLIMLIFVNGCGSVIVCFLLRFLICCRFWDVIVLVCCNCCYWIKNCKVGVVFIVSVWMRWCLNSCCMFCFCFFFWLVYRKMCCVFWL